jgi:hypothetical protein
MSHEIKIGQRIYVKGIGDRRGCGLEKYDITKVGRKYFYATPLGYSYETKFSKDTWREHIPNCSSTYQAYESIEALRGLISIGEGRLSSPYQ